MRKDRRGLDPASEPSGDGCVECLASPRGWWLHLRRCTECGHIGCSDSSPSQHASKHAAAIGHPTLPALNRVRTGSSITRSRGWDQECGVASAALASGKSACAWTGDARNSWPYRANAGPGSIHPSADSARRATGLDLNSELLTYPPGSGRQVVSKLACCGPKPVRFF
jgi:hypothetical protein